MSVKNRIVRSLSGENAGLDIDNDLLIKGRKIVLDHLGASPQTLQASAGSLLLNGVSVGGGATAAVASSRALTAADNGNTLECTAGSITLTVPAGLGANFGCAVIPSGTTSIASSGGTLLNGATTTLTRADSANAIFAIVSRASATDSYVVTGS